MIKPTPLPAQHTQNMLRNRIRHAQGTVVTLRPPPEPTTSCGRECDSYLCEELYAATSYWQEEVPQKLEHARRAVSPFNMGHAPAPQAPFKLRHKLLTRGIQVSRPFDRGDHC